MVKEIIDGNNDVIEIQIDCLHRLELFFQSLGVKDLQVDNYYFSGVRGDYNEQIKYCLHFNFNSLSHNFEFYIDYDQLEFYISKNGKMVKECLLEDFWPPEILVTKFLSYLQHCVSELR